MSYHLTPVRMTVIKKNTNNMLARMWRKGNLCALLVRMQPLWKTVWRFIRKLKRELPYDPAIPFLGIYPKKPNKPKTLKIFWEFC